MKNLPIKNAFIAVVALALALTSCNTSIEIAKRKHRKGYHVSLSKEKNQKSRTLELHSKQDVSKNSVQLAMIDSLAVDTTDIEEFLPENVETFVYKMDSPAVDTTQYMDLKTSSRKFTLAQKIKNVKSIKKKIRQLKHQEGFKSASDDDWEIDSDVMFVVMIVLAIILPPLAVYLIKGKSNAFILNLLLWLVGIGVGIAVFGGLVWWAGLLALIHAILVVLGHS